MADQFGTVNPTGSFMASLMPGSSPIQMPMFDGTGDGAGSGEGDGGTGGAGAGGEDGAGGHQDPSGGGKQSVGGEDGKVKDTGGEKTFTFKEDRADWIPRTRLNDQGAKLTKSQEENKTLAADLAREQARTRALSGVEPVDPKAKETADMKEVLHEMFPQIKAMEGFTPEQVAELLDAANVARSTAKASWERHASTMKTSLEGEAVKALRVDKLTDSQSKRLQAAYREAAYEAVAARPRDEQGRSLADPTDNDFLTRHERGDKTLIAEFIKTYLEDWFEPAKRSVNLEAARRGRPVPSGGRGTQLVASGPKKINFNSDKEFKEALIAARTAGQE